MVLADAPIKPALPVTSPATPPATTEQEIDQRLEGKFMFLRGFYLDDKLEFDLNGKVVGNPQRGSFTLSGLEIRKVHASKHNIVIEADRIGLHFFGGLPYEDDNKPFERIKLSKKPVEITIDRLNIEPEKKKKKEEKEKEAAAAAAAKQAKAGQQPAAGSPSVATNETSGVANPPDVTYDDASSKAPAQPGATADLTAKATPAALPKLPAEPAHPEPKDSWIQLSKALDVVFAPGLDDSVIATLPDYWQVYFATKEGKKQAQSLDSSVLRPGNGVVSPKLLSVLDPASNDYAQKNNIAGMTLLSTIVGASGDASHVSIIRPIGFGLDEKAVDAVSHARFRPGLKDGEPVPVEVNLQVTFRIYSDRTRPEPGAPQHPQTATPATAPQTSHSNGKEVASISPQ